MTKEMFEWITKWQDETFTKATSLSAANHLHEEIKELLGELNDGHTGFLSSNQIGKIQSEYADCFLLLFGSAHKFGMSYDDICEAIYYKMEINKKRQWGNVNEQGYVKHLPSKEQNVQGSVATEADSSTGDDKIKKGNETL